MASAGTEDWFNSSFSSQSYRNSFENSGIEGGGVRKRKRKNGFFSRAKKFGRQGKLGHGYEIDTETYSYFLRVLELCQKNEFEDEDEKEVFIENAFVQTENEEVNLSSNQMTSRALETLLAETTNPDILKRFTLQFSPSLRTICTDPYASHVVEKLLIVISTKWTHNKSLIKWFRNTCKYVLNNFEEFIFDNYANRIMRKVCQCLSGTSELFLNSSVKHGRNNQFQNSTNEFVIPPIAEIIKVRNPEADEDEKFRKNRKRNVKILRKFAGQFLGWPQFNDLFQKELTSGFVQVFLTTLIALDDELVSDGILQVIGAIKEDFDLHSLPQLFSVEVCVTLSQNNETIFKLLYIKYLQGKMTNLALDKYGHFTLEKLLTTIQDSDLFEEMYDNLESQFEAIYKSGYFSVFTAISDACLRLKVKQPVFVERLAILLQEISKDSAILESPSKKGNVVAIKEESQNLVEILCRFGKPLVKREDESTFLQTEFNGCMVLQNILLFHKPFKIVSSLLELDGARLKTLSTDPKCSHVIDSFLKSNTISEKYKDQFISKLKEYFVPLALQKFGARVLDNYWAIASIKNKAIIASSLSEREALLNANNYGKFLSIKCALSLYKRNTKQWTEFMSKEAGAKKKKQKLAEDIMTDLGLNPSE